MTAAGLDDEERAALARLLAVVLPSGPGAGADDAVAVDYVLARLDGPEAGVLDELRSLLASASGQEEAELARLCAAGDPWFVRIREWAWEGFLCDPGLGGNRGRVGWERFGALPHRRAVRP